MRRQRLGRDDSVGPLSLNDLGTQWSVVRTVAARPGTGGVDRRHEPGRSDPPKGRPCRRPSVVPVLDGIVAAWAAWSVNAPDVGFQTRNVLTGLEARKAPVVRAAAWQEHEYKGRSAGKSSLVRTAPLVLAFLRGDVGEEERLAAAARAISDLTHYESDAQDARGL